MKKNILLIALIAIVLPGYMYGQCSVVGEPGSLPVTVDAVTITEACAGTDITFTLPNVAAELDQGLYLGPANDGSIGVPPVDPVTFPDILLAPGYDIYAVSPSIGDVYMGTEYGPALDGDGIIDGTLANPSCAAEVQTFYSLPIIDAYEFDQVAGTLGAFLGTFVGDDAANPQCGQGAVVGSVTVYPVLTAVDVTADATTCGTLTVELQGVDAAGATVVCDTQTQACAADGDVLAADFSAAFADPQGCSTLTATSAACAGCVGAVCDGVVDYPDLEVCNAAIDGTGTVATFTPTTCTVTPEVDNGDGTLTVVSLDIYSPDASDPANLLGSLFESATFALSACDPLAITLPDNLGCVGLIYQFEIVTAINIINAADGTFVSDMIDPECTSEIMTVTQYPVLAATDVTADAATCGTLQVDLLAQDGTVCDSQTQACAADGDVLNADFSAVVADPQGCSTLTAASAACAGCAPAMCNGVVDYPDLEVCNAAIDGTGTVATFTPTTCTVTPEVDNGDGTLTVVSLDIYSPDASDPANLLGSLFESATFALSACDTLAITLPDNLGCAGLIYQFEIVTAINIINAADGTFVSDMIDPLCTSEIMTVTQYPVLAATDVTADAATCGTLQVDLLAQDGTVCDSQTQACVADGDVLNADFSAAVTDPQGCSTLTATSAACAGCAPDVCTGVIDYPDLEVCNAATDGTGTLATFTPTTCTLNPEIDNGDGTLTVISLDIYSPDATAGTFLGSLFESATFGATACGDLAITLPDNLGCAPLAYQFEIVTAINIVNVADGTIVSFMDDPLCTSEIMTVTQYPVLAATDVTADAATCGTLQVDLLAQDGTVCDSQTQTCMADGDVLNADFSAVVTDPQGCSTLTTASAACAGCAPDVCNGTVDYIDGEACNLDTDLDGDGVVDGATVVTATVAACNINPEVDNGDGTLTIYSFDIYQDDGAGNLSYITSLFESATFGVTACDDFSLAVPVNTTCAPQTYLLQAITASNVVDATGAIVDFADDLLCTPEAFSVTVYPVLTATDVSADAAACGTLQVDLLAEDGSVCDSQTQACADNGDVLSADFSASANDPLGCSTLTTASAACAGCAMPMAEITDPCNCVDGIDLDGDGTNDLALETITITDPAGTGQAWAITNAATSGLVEPDGMGGFVPTTATVMDMGDGTYTFTAYVPTDGSTYSADFANGAGTMTLNQVGGPCPACIDISDVPTVGEWGLIMLGLLMSITAIVGIRQRREEEAIA